MYPDNLEGDRIMARRLNAHLKKTEIKKIKNELISIEERIINKQLAKKVQFSFSEKSDNKDDVDSANNNILISNDLRFSNRERLYLKKVKDALSRIESDEFGMCTDCGSEINFVRLQARPTSELCISCKEESERDENNRGRVSKSLGKTVQLV